jgi:hypothetical protein
MTRAARLTTVVIRLVVVLTLVATPLIAVYRWPLNSLFVVYVLGCAVVAIRQIRAALAPPPDDVALSWLFGSFARTALSAERPLNRLRRHVSVACRMTGMVALWPKNVALMLLIRPFYRRDAAGRIVPKTSRPLPLFYGQNALDATLFVALPVGLFALVATGHRDERLTAVLFAVLAVGLLSRHLSMLIFPHDLKESMRRTPGDPRVMFALYLCIDTFAFAALVQWLRFGGEAAHVGLNGLTRTAWDLIALSQVRLVLEQVKEAFGRLGPHPDVLLPLTRLSAAQAFEAICSAFVSLNIVRIVFPLRSWQQTDDDLKVMARGFLLFGNTKEARVYIERIKTYDVETAGLDAWATASAGNLRAAAAKIRWVHGRNALPADPDLVFTDTVGSPVVTSTAPTTLAELVSFAIELQVSDASLATSVMYLSVLMRPAPRAALDVVAGEARLETYPLTIAALLIGGGEFAAAHARLDTCVSTGVVARCAKILLEQIANSGLHPGEEAESVERSAASLVRIVNAADVHALPLSGLLALVSTMTAIRAALASTGGATADVIACADRLLAHIRETYPSHRRSAVNLGHFGRVAELDMRRESHRKRSHPATPAPRSSERSTVG